jgi:plastocyanin
MKKWSISLFIILSSIVAVAQEKSPQPTRELSVILTAEGYYPKNLNVFEGEKVKFYLTSTVEDPGCMIIQGHEVFMAANKGKVTEAEVVFGKEGSFSFYCPSNRKNDGKLTVMKKIDPNAKKRGIASERSSDPALWTPKEY